MGKGIILRILEGTELPAAITQKLQELFPGYTLEHFRKQPDYKQSISARINSLHQAFLFLLDAYPPTPSYTRLNKDTLRTYVEMQRAQCHLNQENFQDLHKELEQFTEKLIAVLLSAWTWTDGSEKADNSAIKKAIACLNEAEQYHLMMQGRADIATVTAIHIQEKTEYIIQWDKSLPPYYDLLIQELNTIKQHHYPKTPTWFRQLSPSAQSCLCSPQQALISFRDFRTTLSTLENAWRIIMQQNRKTLATELKNIKDQNPPYPTWFSELTPPFQTMIQEWATTAGTITHNLKALNDFINARNLTTSFDTEFKTLSQLPLWYWTLSHQQQCFLEHTLKQDDCIENVFSALSSRHRTLPAPANYGAHQLVHIDSEGQVSSLSTERYRSSHVASRDVLQQPPLVQERHSDANLAKVTEHAQPGQLILWQTLISPIAAKDYMPQFVSDYLPELPDNELHQLGIEAAKRSYHHTRLYEHNHPFNMAKRVYYTAAKDSRSLALIGVIRQSDNLEAQVLAQDYADVLESPFGSATWNDYNGRELFLSSLEQLMILCSGGYSYGSCVSGKDRKAIELLHTDAMLLYKHYYRCWPKYTDTQENRQRFVELLTELYLSRHQQTLAAQNAPGAEGIKTPNCYLPGDVCASINLHLNISEGLNNEDRLASDNEVKAIHQKGALKRALPAITAQTATLIALQLGTARCTSLYDVLYSLLNERQLFLPKSSSQSVLQALSLYRPNEQQGSTPTGIERMRQLMVSISDETICSKFAQIITIVLERPEEDLSNSRTPATQSVYQGIRSLCYFNTREENTQPIDELLKNTWRSLFQAAKAQNQSTPTRNEETLASTMSI